MGILARITSAAKSSSNKSNESSLSTGGHGDDAVRQFLKLSEPDYYALLIAIAVSILLGGLVTWLIGG